MTDLPSADETRMSFWTLRLTKLICTGCGKWREPLKPPAVKNRSAVHSSLSWHGACGVATDVLQELTVIKGRVQRPATVRGSHHSTQDDRLQQSSGIPKLSICQYANDHGWYPDNRIAVSCSRWPTFSRSAFQSSKDSSLDKKYRSGTRQIPFRGRPSVPGEL